MQQTYQNLEIILVDDGSPDRCPQICDLYASKDKRIKVIHKENGGLVTARKAGVQIAQGEYIGFVDGDDWVGVGFYQSMLNTIMACDADIAVAGCSRDLYRKTITMENALPLGVYEGESMEYFRKNMMSFGSFFRFGVTTYHWNKLYRREAIIPFQMAVENGFTVMEDGATTYPAMLAAKKVVSDYVMATSMNAYHVAQAAVQQAQAQLAMEQTNLGYCTVTSPITGMIKENGFKIGEIADLTKLLCTVSDDSQIQAWFSYTESQLMDLMKQYHLKATAEGLKDENGQPVGNRLPKLRLQLKNGHVYYHEGVVTEIGGIVDRRTGTVICKATFPNPNDELRSGLSATLIFPTKMDSVYRVPQTAAVRLQNQLMFYRVKKDGTAEGVICEAIPSNSGNHYYIKSGLKEGDEVVVKGAHKLSNGMKVR
jgi:RND family efflux transporter MFP subunit